VLTERIKLGTGVTCIPNHNPAQLAYRIAQLDNMLRGRFLWGVGAGGFAGDAKLFEIPQDGTHRRVTQESIDAVLEIWAANGTGFSWQNDYFHFTIPDDAPVGRTRQPPEAVHASAPADGVAGVSKSSSTLRWAASAAGSR